LLRAIPQGWFSNDYQIHRDGVQVAFLDPSAWREKAELEIEGRRYHLDREGWVGEFRLLDELKHPVITATKPSAFRKRFEVTWGDRRYVLEKATFWTSGFAVREVTPGETSSGDGTRTVGSILREGFLTRRAVLDLPEDWPLPVQVFVFWLVVVIWTRERAAAASGGS
jgi:hypothetical protein